MKIQIVIVHPSGIVQMALSDVLKLDASFHVSAAHGSGTDLIKRLETFSEHVDVILLDPTLESVNLIDHIAAVSDAKIILLTLDDGLNVYEAWIKGGVRGILGREADLTVLSKAISKVHAGEFWLNRLAVSRLLSREHIQAEELTPERARIAQLTVKEKLVIQAVLRGRGQTLLNTARDLSLSDKTIRNHLTSIYAKLAVANKTELVLFAQKHLNLSH